MVKKLVTLRTNLKKYKFVIILLCLIVICVITISYGHSDINFTSQLKSEMNKLNTDSILSFNTDKKASQEIINSNRPLKIQVLYTEKDYSDKTNPIRNSVINVNGENYQVQFICHNKPFSWTLFEIWEVNSIVKKNDI